MASNVRVSAAVMAHRVREAEVEELLGALDRPVPVAWDSRPEPSSDPRQRWATGRAAWQLADPDADYHLVIQDDALVVPDLLAGLEVALAYVPSNAIVCPYVGTKRPDKGGVRRSVAAANRADASWITMRSLMWGVAIIAPVATIPEMLACCDQAGPLAYDKRVGQYYRDRLGWRTWYPWPSLVDHRQGLSLCGHDNGGRWAHRMLEGSALARRWNGPVIDPRQPART